MTSTYFIVTRSEADFGSDYYSGLLSRPSAKVFATYIHCYKDDTCILLSLTLEITCSKVGEPRAYVHYMVR